MGIFKRGDSPFWWYKIQLNGRRVTGSTNTSDAKLAQRIFLEKSHQFNEELHLPGQRGKSTSFFWMCDYYLDTHAKVNKVSWRTDQIHLDKLKRHFGDVPLAEIQPQHIERYKAQRLSRVKQSSINRELAVLKGLFSKAIRWGYASRNPVKETDLFKEERTPVRLLTDEERRRFLAEAPDFLRPILETALKTGMRLNEILSLEWTDVDFAHDIISVRHTKAKKLRELPLLPKLKHTLLALPRASKFVFCNRFGDRYHRNGIVREAFEKLRERVGMPELTFHMLRHNFASELISKGADPRTVQEYLGHSSLRMLQRYAHVSKGTWRSTIQLLEGDD